MSWIFLSVIVTLILFIILGLNYRNGILKFKFRARQVLSILGLFIMVFGMIKSVDANQVGIKYDPFNGGVQNTTLQEGIYFTAPWVRLYNINTIQKELSFEPFSVQTMDSEYAMFLVEMKYKVSKENAFEVFRNYQGLPSNSVIETDVQNAIKTHAIKYNIYGILGEEFATLKQEAYDDLQTTLKTAGIDLISLNFIDIDAGDSIEQKIVEKGLAKQKKDIEIELKAAAEIEQERRTVEAETNLIEQQKKTDAEAYKVTKEAEAEASAKELAADAEAYRILIEAQSEEEAINLIITAYGTSEAYLQALYYEAWSGDVPDTVLGTNTGVVPIFPIE